MSMIPQIAKPGEGLIVREDDARVTLSYVDADGVIQVRPLQSEPEIRAALAGAPYVRVDIVAQGRVARLPTGFMLPLPPVAS